MHDWNIVHTFVGLPFAELYNKSDSLYFEGVNII
jgi:hypothetical protein